MAAAGILDILIANQIVGSEKIGRLVALCEIADPIVAVDNSVHISALAAASSHAARPLRLVVEVNIGMNRAGVEPGDEAVRLAAEISGHSGLHFEGLMAWESHAVLIADPREKEQSVRIALARLANTANLCRASGYPVSIVSCGGSGTFPFCIAQPGVTEVQVGGAIFSDMHYREHYHLDFPPALTLLTTVTSRPNSNSDHPRCWTQGVVSRHCHSAATPPSTVKCDERFSAEHATLELAEPSETPRIGERVEFIVGYSDMTVFLHEELVGHRRGEVEAVWRVAARGRLK